MTTEKSKKFIYNLAGVTYSNDDGESRQSILASLPEWTTVTFMRTIFHNEKTGVDEPAIKVFEKRTRKQLGWIPRKNIDDAWAHSGATCHIMHNERGYFATLSEVRPPSKKQYAIMKSISEKKNTPMPAYDQRAFVALVINKNN